MTDRAAYIQGLRQLADALEAHPWVPLPTSGIMFGFHGDADARGQVAAVARALPCSWRKNVWDGQSGSAYIDLTGKIAGLPVHISAYRDDVCTRVVTGTEKREVEETVTPAVTRQVVREVEVVEWECHSVLAPAREEPAAVTS